MQQSHVVLRPLGGFDLLPATVPCRMFGGQPISLPAIKCSGCTGLRMNFLSKRISRYGKECFAAHCDRQSIIRGISGAEFDVSQIVSRTAGFGLLARCCSRVEEGRGGGRLPVTMAGAFAGGRLSPACRGPVSPPRSSNRTCRFPASGFTRRKVKSIFPVSPHLLLLASSGCSGHHSGIAVSPPGADVQI